MMTTAGMYGFVTAVEGDVIWLEIAEGVDIRIARQAVSRRIPAGEDAESDSPAKDTETMSDDPADSTDQKSNGAKGEQDAPSAD